MKRPQICDINAGTIRCINMQPCKDDMTRVLANPSLIPRWRKGSMTNKNRCCVRLCGQSIFVHCRLASSEQMQAVLKFAHLKCISDTVPVPVPLCKHHYHSKKLHKIWYIPKAWNTRPNVMSETRTHWKAPQRQNWVWRSHRGTRQGVYPLLQITPCLFMWKILIALIVIWGSWSTVSHNKFPPVMQ